MPPPQLDIGVRITVLDSQGKPLGDTVDLEFQPRNDAAAPDVFKAFQFLPNLDWDNPKLRFIDLTGDGLPDLLSTEDCAFHWYASLGARGFADAQRVGPFARKTAEKAYYFGERP